MPGYLYLSALGPGSVSWFMAAFKAGLGGTGSSAQTSCWLQVWSNGCAGAVPTLVTGDPALLYIDSRNCLSQHLIAVTARCSSLAGQHKAGFIGYQVQRCPEMAEMAAVITGTICPLQL